MGHATNNLQNLWFLWVLHDLLVYETVRAQKFLLLLSYSVDCAFRVKRNFKNVVTHLIIKINATENNYLNLRLVLAFFILNCPWSS